MSRIEIMSPRDLDNMRAACQLAA
ncbi:MAG: hypothetical protein JWN04_3627, partial [Myxococcaceae bacterium]|nr:hypothetical protein [Myxococcaceae bacterium]